MLAYHRQHMRIPNDVLLAVIHIHQNRIRIKSKSSGLPLAAPSRSAGWSTRNLACFYDTIVVNYKSSNVMLSELQSLLGYLYYSTVLPAAYRFIHGAFSFVRFLIKHFASLVEVSY